MVLLPSLVREPWCAYHFYWRSSFLLVWFFRFWFSTRHRVGSKVPILWFIFVVRFSVHRIFLPNYYCGSPSRSGIYMPEFRGLCPWRSSAAKLFLTRPYEILKWWLYIYCSSVIFNFSPWSGGLLIIGLLIRWVFLRRECLCIQINGFFLVTVKGNDKIA